mmetsp:Transcript_19654/g.26435  ORF Transcript_19654/g.26435 Transcript_19654/m.26435 type:complete len:121 (-) Transcript_19654:145-507(-)
MVFVMVRALPAFAVPALGAAAAVEAVGALVVEVLLHLVAAACLAAAGAVVVVDAEVDADVAVATAVPMAHAVAALVLVDVAAAAAVGPWGVLVALTVHMALVEELAMEAMGAADFQGWCP